MKTLKLVRAIVPPDKLMTIKNALEENGFLRMLLTPVGGTGKQPPSSFFQCSSFRGSNLLPWIQLEMVVDYSHADALISTIMETSRTGCIDVHILIMPVERTILV